MASGWAVIFTVCLFLTCTTILTWCFAVRAVTVTSWRSLSYSRWLVTLVYIDSYCFVSSTSILQLGVGVTQNLLACEAAIFMCILFYFTSKVFIYLFLIERVHLVHGRSRTSRLKDKLYRINLVGLLPYCVIGLLAIHFRNYEISQSGRCSIGVQRQTSILVIVYDLCINLYLTVQFLLPILGLYSFQNDIPHTPLHKLARRTFIGTLATLASSAANITALFILRGKEPAFVCLTCCSVDVSFSAIVLHWITSVRTEERAVSPPAIDCAVHGTSTAECCLKLQPRDVRCTNQPIFRRARLQAKASFRRITDQIRGTGSKAASSGTTKPGENLVVVSYEVWTSVEEAKPTKVAAGNVDLQNCI